MQWSRAYKQQGLKHGLRASSMMESVIAIAIIAACISIAALIYGRSMNQNYPFAFYKAKHEMAVLLHQTQQEQSFEDEKFRYEGFSIQKNVNDLEDNTAVKEVVFVIEAAQHKKEFTYIVTVEN